MKIILLKHWGLNPPNTIMEIPASSAELLIGRGVARQWEPPIVPLENRQPENTSMKRARVERK